MLLISVAYVACVQLDHDAAVYADGGICLDILQNQWSPIYDVSAILTSIQVCSMLLRCTSDLACYKIAPVSDCMCGAVPSL